MKILFIGGYGNISWHCTKKAIEAGHDVYLLNRDLKSGTRREIPKEAKIIKCDYRNQDEVKQALKDECFDVVCDFICYNAPEAYFALELFRDKTAQYIVTSSAANYDRTSAKYPLREDAPQFSDFPYVKNKIEMEAILKNAAIKTGFPLTVVRPGQIYDTLVPDCVGNADFTNIQRMIKEKPVLILGEGETPWTLLHSKDFAEAYCTLIGNKKAIGKDFTIAGEEFLNWNKITDLTASALGVTAKKIHVTTDFIEKFEPELAAGLRSHKIYADIYDLTKIKEISGNWSPKIKFEDGIKESIKWLLENPKRRRINQELNQKIDSLIEKWNSI